jgi:hypothetical protein
MVEEPGQDPRVEELRRCETQKEHHRVLQVPDVDEQFHHRTCSSLNQHCCSQWR